MRLFAFSNRACGSCVYFCALWLSDAHAQSPAQLSGTVLARRVFHELGDVADDPTQN